jgi:hypothetical protein
VNIGTPIREIQVEPLVVPASPQREPVPEAPERPREPLPLPEREKIPA